MMDAIEERKRSDPHVTWKDMVAVAVSCGLPSDTTLRFEDEVKYVLLYLNELGTILWCDEDGVRDLIILVSVVVSFAVFELDDGVNLCVMGYRTPAG